MSAEPQQGKLGWSNDVRHGDVSECILGNARVFVALDMHTGFCALAQRGDHKAFGGASEDLAELVLQVVQYPSERYCWSQATRLVGRRSFVSFRQIGGAKGRQGRGMIRFAKGWSYALRFFAVDLVSALGPRLPSTKFGPILAVLLLLGGCERGSLVRFEETTWASSPDTNVLEYPLLTRLRLAPKPGCLEGRLLTQSDMRELWRILHTEHDDLQKLARYIGMAGGREDIGRMIRYLNTGGNGHLSVERLPGGEIVALMLEMLKAMGGLGERLGASGDLESAMKVSGFLRSCGSPDFWNRKIIGKVLAKVDSVPSAHILLSAGCLRSLALVPGTSSVLRELRTELESSGQWSPNLQGAYETAELTRRSIDAAGGLQALDQREVPQCSGLYW